MQRAVVSKPSSGLCRVGLEGSWGVACRPVPSASSCVVRPAARGGRTAAVARCDVELPGPGQLGPLGLAA